MSLPNKVILVNREEWEREKQEELDRKQKLGRRRRFLEDEAKEIKRLDKKMRTRAKKPIKRKG
tara:strand:+ start:685 stop:873 length:189 start_codon:yes stop_codon:yes gene_type:complete